MNVKLNIHEDAELRAEVREMIRGQVKSAHAAIVARNNFIISNGFPHPLQEVLV